MASSLALITVLLCGCATPPSSAPTAKKERAPKLPPPSVMLLMADKRGSAYAADVESSAMSVLLQRGYTTIDQTVARENKEKILALLAASGDEHRAAAIGAGSGADIIVQGSAETRTLASGIQGSNLKSFSATVTLRAVDADNGRILATSMSEARVVALNPETGYIKALRESSAKAANELALPLANAWRARPPSTQATRASRTASITEALDGYDTDHKAKEPPPPPPNHQPSIAAIWSLTAQAGVQEDWMPALTETAQTVINQSGWFRVVGREDMKQVLAEHSIQMSDLCDTTERAVEFGKILSADHMIIGSVGRLAGTYQVILKLVHVDTGEVRVAGRAEARGGNDILFYLVREAAADLLFATERKQTL